VLALSVLLPVQNTSQSETSDLATVPGRSSQAWESLTSYRYPAWFRAWIFVNRIGFIALWFGMAMLACAPAASQWQEKLASAVG